MQEQNSPRRLPLSMVAGLSVLILATGSAVALWSWHSISRKGAEPAAIQPSNTGKDEKNPPAAPFPDRAHPPQAIAPATTERTLAVYWVNGNGKNITLVPVTVTLGSTQNSTAGVRTALQQLLAGPGDSSVTTTIPKGTRLLDIAEQKDGIHLNLSKEFTGGGGSASMTARVGQILYTATSLKPEAPVWIAVEGKPLETLGGEGLMLEQPLTRKNFEKDFAL